MAGAEWLGWITMRGNDGAIDNILTNPKRWSRVHLFPDASRVAVCGVVRPADDDHLGLVQVTDHGSVLCKFCEQGKHGFPRARACHCDH